MKFIMIFSLITSICFFVVSHPMMFIMLILTQTLNLCVLIFVSHPTSWFSFILFLIFLGGLMVLFIYVASLASNEKFKIEFSILIKLVLGLTFAMAAAVITYQQQTNAQNLDKVNLLLTQMFTQTLSYLTMMAMLYLLLTLIVVVTMASKYEGPLRNMLFK